jgi:hypothetical protein
MDQVTQQNAALVEEAAAAAQSLQEQAAGLSQVVSVFRLDQEQALSQGASTRRAAAHYPRTEPVQPPPARPAITASKPKRGSEPLPSRRLAVATAATSGAGERQEF